MAVVLGPYAGRLLADLRSAERERIRTEERAEIAAQLHDSVLQTLALMQRAADDPRRMVLLARRQERELRQWLYGGGPGVAARPWPSTRQALAAEIELDHDVPVELVVVGDHPVDEAARRACSARCARPPSTRPSTPARDEVDDLRRGRAERRCPRSSGTRGCGFDPDGRAPRPAGHHALDPRPARTLRRAGRGWRPTPGDGHGVGAGGATVMTGPAPPRVFVVDDHALFRAGVRAELGAAVDIVGDAGDVDDRRSPGSSPASPRSSCSTSTCPAGAGEP